MKSTKKPAKADTKKDNKAIVPTQQKPLAKSAASFYEEDAGQGQEGMSRDDYAIPRLVILQKLSEQLDKKHEKFLPDAEEGDICDVVTGEVWSAEDGIKVLPVTYRKTHIEWKPRSKGGGFVKDHGPDYDIAQCSRDNDDGKLTLPNGNVISVVGEYFVMLLLEDGSTRPYMVSFAGSQLKKSRRWNTVMSQLRVAKDDSTGTFNPATFFKSYHLTTVPESNDKGNWMGWKIEPAEDVTVIKNGQEIYVACREFRKQIADGIVKASAPVDDAPSSGSTPDDEAAM